MVRAGDGAEDGALTHATAFIFYYIIIDNFRPKLLILAPVFAPNGHIDFYFIYLFY